VTTNIDRLRYTAKDLEAHYPGAPAGIVASAFLALLDDRRFEAAKAAMQGMVGSPEWQHEAKQVVGHNEGIDQESAIAHWSVKQADALLAALEVDQ
jgi:hypothetical protein